MYQQLWGYKVEEKLYLGVREQKRLNTTALNVTETADGSYYVSPTESSGDLGIVTEESRPLSSIVHK
jgi:hypothetical protein